MKRIVFKNFVKSTGKQSPSPFFNKVGGRLKKRLRYRCFIVSFAKFLRTLF